MLESISIIISSYNTIKTFVLSISCTNTLHTNLKELVQICFINKKNGQRSFRKRQLYLAIYTCSNKTFSEPDIIKNSIFYFLGNVHLCICKVRWINFQQTVCITMGMNCAPLSPTCSFIRMKQTSWWDFERKNGIRIMRCFYFMFRYIHIDDVLSFSNSRYDDYVDSMYPIELEIQGRAQMVLLEQSNSIDWIRFAIYDH